MVSVSEELSTSLKALSDPTRLAIVATLASEELSVHQVAEMFPISRPAISKHLKILRQAGLVGERAEGRERIYSIETAPLRAVRVWLQRFDRGGNGSGARGTNPIRRYAGAKGSGDDWRVW